MIKLVLVRHGQSMWNLENKFTGWTDVELSEKGVEEAKVSLEEKQATIKFDETKTNIENIKEAIADTGFKGE